MVSGIKRKLITAVSLILAFLPLMATTVASASPIINYYQLTTEPNVALNYPGSITTGPDGALWFTATAGSDGGHIGRMTTAGTVTGYFLTPTSGNPSGITTGPDGALWFIESDVNQIGRITTTGSVTEFPLGGPLQTGNTGNGPSGVTTGPDGSLWFAALNNGNAVVGTISASGSTTTYPIPNTNGFAPGIGKITAGPDGALWFTECNFSYTHTTSDMIDRITTSGTVTKYPLATPNSCPNDIVTGPDGALWFTESNGIGRITTSGTITEYTANEPQTITTGPDGALWFSTVNKVGRISTSGVVSYYPFSPGPGGINSLGITTGPDSALWFTEYGVAKIGQLIQVPTPSSPTNLTASSPAQFPFLSWTASSGATSYNVYRNGTNIRSTTNTSYTDNTAPEGTDTYYVTAVNSGGESGPSNSVNVLVDRTAPTITYSVSPTPNSNGWNNSPVTVTFACTDNTGGSGVATYSSPQSESVDGTYTLTGTCIDNAGNSSSVDVPVNIDQTAPTVSNVTLATDPLAVNQTTTLSAAVADNLSGVSNAEYYTGTDPGQGNGTPMTIANGTATATVGSYATAGMHTYFVRTQDNAGNWSSPMSVILDVYNPAGGYTAGHGSVIPNGSTSNTNPSDVLPTESGNNLSAKFDFTVKYVNSTDTTPTGTSTFTWGSTCNNPHANCFVVTTDTIVNPAIGSLAWLIVPGDNTATFQGTASLSQGSTNLGTNYPVRITVTGTTATSPGHYLLQVYSVGSNPDTASPLYQASGDLSAGSVVLHR